MRPRQDTADTLPAIEDAKTYSMATFCQVTGMRRHALRSARARGLKVVKLGGRCFIRGRDFSEFLGGLAEGGGK